jgi:MoxR-like ATPase
MKPATDELTPLVKEETFYLERVQSEIKKRIVGQTALLDSLMIALLTGGHLLLEGVPGLAKTLAVKSLAEAIDVGFRRIQFTPDLLPADLIGTMIFDQKTGTFIARQGPVFSNLLLADEVNRAPAKVQSALLECMQEKQVTLGNHTFRLQEPFMVLATQNPIEQEGTYPLPEAQLDRFSMRINLGYPAAEHEVDVLYSQFHHHPLDDIGPVFDSAVLVQLQDAARAVRVERSIGGYIVALAEATRRHPQLRMGCSPRGALALFRVTQARALVSGRDYAIPEDVKAVAVRTLAHRLALDTKAKYSGVQKEDIVREVLDRQPVGA